MPSFDTDIDRSEFRRHPFDASLTASSLVNVPARRRSPCALPRISSATIAPAWFQDLDGDAAPRSAYAKRDRPADAARRARDETCTFRQIGSCHANLPSWQ